MLLSKGSSGVLIGFGRVLNVLSEGDELVASGLLLAFSQLGAASLVDILLGRLSTGHGEVGVAERGREREFLQTTNSKQRYKTA